MNKLYVAMLMLSGLVGVFIGRFTAVDCRDTITALEQELKVSFDLNDSLNTNLKDGEAALVTNLGQCKSNIRRLSELYDECYDRYERVTQELDKANKELIDNSNGCRIK